MFFNAPPVSSVPPFPTILFSQPSSSSNIKTIDGLARASVKTVNGLALGSVKTVNGLA